MGARGGPDPCRRAGLLGRAAGLGRHRLPPVRARARGVQRGRERASREGDLPRRLLLPAETASLIGMNVATASPEPDTPTDPGGEACTVVNDAVAPLWTMWSHLRPTGGMGLEGFRWGGGAVRAGCGAM